MKNNSIAKIALSYLWITLGAAIYAVSFNWFYLPNHIGFGGITGIGQIINAALPWAPIGIIVIVMNVPLFLMGWRLLGGHLLVSSLYAMFISSVAIDVLASFHTFAAMDKMLASVYGGVGMGLGLGIVFLVGATTGGTDLIARLLKLKLAWLPMGRMLLMIDLLVILSVSIAFRRMDSALYGVIALYISTLVMDMVLYGLDTAKVAYIISDAQAEIAQQIVIKLDRGVTILHGEGAFSGDDKRVLLCAFKQRQIVQLKELVKELDPTAFCIVCNAHEILGEGFHEYKKNEI